MKIIPSVQNEYGKLKQVVVSQPDSEKVIKMLSPKGRLVTVYAVHEHKNLVDVLLKYGVEVIKLDNSKCESFTHVFVRDPFMVLGNTLFLNKVAEHRVDEWHAMNDVMLAAGREHLYGYNSRTDGGDVIIHNGDIFVGRGGCHTAEQSIQTLTNIFAKRCNVIPVDLNIKPASYVYHRKKQHLDCVFNPISKNQAIVYADGLAQESLAEIREAFDVIKVSKKEQAELAVNVLSLGNKVIVSQKRHTRLNSELKRQGFTVEEIEFDTFVNGLGAFRCATCPISRDR